MIKLTIDNVFIDIRGMSKECEFAVYDKLAFDVQEFNSPYLKRRHLYNRKTHKTYTGLLQYIIDIFDERGEEYEINDIRNAWQQNADFKLVEYIDDDKKIKLQARPYQQELIDNASNREIITAATGAGKTFIMAALIAKYNVKPVSVFADKMALCTQLRDEFQKFLGIEVGLVGGGINDKKDITVYSVQSAQPEDVQDSKLIMFDECLEYNQLILMGDGSYRKIGDLVRSKSNEKVMTYNHITKKNEPKPIYAVSETRIKNKKLMFIILICNYNVTEIKCTDNHRFWVENLKKYIKASELSVGMDVIFSNGNIGKVKKISELEKNNNMRVYDISVKDNHNFFCNDVLVHNCHHIPASTMTEIANASKNAYYRIGVSATPWRDSGDELLIDAVVAKRNDKYKINASKLIDLGYLVPCTIYLVPHRKQFKGKNYNKLYNEAIVENKDRNNDIVKIAEKMNKIRKSKILILIKNVRHGEILLEMLNKKIEKKEKLYTVKNDKGKEFTINVKNIEFLSGKDDSIRRKAVITAAKEGFVDILIGSTIADEGLDIPILDTLILAGGGRSSTRAFQRIGRVLRLYPGKTKAYVFDFEDSTPMLRRHSDIRRRLYKTEPRWEIKQFNSKLLR